MKKMTALSLIMLNVAAIGSLNNLPSLAAEGFASVSYYLVAVVLFFIPYSLISAELASAFPEDSGIYVWVKAAFGHQWGFIAVWLQWLENIFWYPTILSFIAATLGHYVDPQLAHHPAYNLITTLGIYWLLTVINFVGIRVSNILNFIGSSIGILIPGLLLIVMGIFWYSGGHSTTLSFQWHALVPHLSDVSNLAFLVGIAQTLAGLEMSAVHTRYVANPQRTFPFAILVSGLMVFALSVLGSLAISALVPTNMLDINNGVVEAFAVFFQAHNMNYILYVVALLLVIGGMTAANAWISGPSSGLAQAAHDNCLPACFKRVNANGVSVSVLVTQGILVSVLCSAFVLMPTVSSAYWLLTAIAGQLYLAMYILMFIAAIKLRNKRSYAYQIAGLKTTRYVSIFGAVGCACFIIIGFLPPTSLQITGLFSYCSIQMVIFVSMLLMPLLIYRVSQSLYMRSANNQLATVEGSV